MISSRKAREALLRRASDEFLLHAFDMHEQALDEHPYIYCRAQGGQAWRAGIYIARELKRRGYRSERIPGTVMHRMIKEEN